MFSDVENYPLYQSALELLDDQPIPCRTIRTDMVGCNSDAEYYAKLHCIRLAFQLLFKVSYFKRKLKIMVLLTICFAHNRTQR